MLLKKQEGRLSPPESKIQMELARPLFLVKAMILIVQHLAKACYQSQIMSIVRTCLLKSRLLPVRCTARDYYLVSWFKPCDKLPGLYDYTDSFMPKNTMIHRACAPVECVGVR